MKHRAAFGGVLLWALGMGLALADPLSPSAEALPSSPSATCSDLETQLQALRSDDKGVVLSTLESVSTCAGFPASEEPLLPALLWVKHQGDPDLVAASSDLLKAMGWPHTYCIHCLRAFASREDNVYKLMGIRALAALAWKDPEAMLALLEITAQSGQPVRSMARSEGVALEAQACPNDEILYDWNRRAAAFLGRFDTVFASNKKALRPWAELLSSCNTIDPSLQRMAQDYLARVPAPVMQNPSINPQRTPSGLQVGE